jgi:transketolase
VSGKYNINENINKLCPIVRESYLHKWSHIPSALSMYDYIDVLFKNKFIDIDRGDRIVLGKPHGAQAYYLPWKSYNLIDDYEHLNTSIKMHQIPFIDYTIDILGDALGIAAGIALGVKHDRVWVNLGDGTLQMGNVLEAIQFIGHNKLKNVVVTVDYNNGQRTGACSDVLNIAPVFDFFKNYSWQVIFVDGHNRDDIYNSWRDCVFDAPTVFVYKTIKGYGYPIMINNIMEWHYKTLNEKDIRQILS